MRTRDLSLVVLCFGMMFGCNSERSEPTLQETVDYMNKSLKVNYGESAPLPANTDVKHIENLRLNGCKLYREVTNYESIEYDLSDIDTSTIGLERIGEAWWVTFKTRNFSRSIRNIGLKDAAANYSTDKGGFALHDKDSAEHFSKAVVHAARVCGGKPSTF